MSDVYQGQNAEILQATIDGTPYTEQPQSYIAQLLIELKETIEAGGGGGGGTTNYNALSNKPQINSITLQGNETAADLGLQAILEFDSTPTTDSTNPVTSGGVKAALNQKQNNLIFDNAPTENSNNPVKSGGIYTALESKQDELTFDSTPTASSTNPVTSGGVKAALDQKQDTLTIDSALSGTSENPVQNKAIKAAIDGKQDELTFDSTPTENSTNPVTSGGIFTALGNFYTKVDVDALISAIQSLKKEVVAELPTTDISTDTIYLVPSSSSQTQNVYDEYLYINNAWERIGSTEVDLSNYYTKTEVDTALANKQDTLTFDNAPTASSNNPVKSGGVYTALASKQDELTFDSTPTASSTNPVTSGGVKAALDQKQDTLTIDSALSSTSENPVQNKAIKAAIDGKQDELTFDSTPTASSTNPVTSGGVKAALDNKQDTLTFDNAPTANSNNPVKSSGIKTAIDAVNDKLYSSIAGIAQNNKGSMELYSQNLNNITTSGFYNAMTCTNAPASYCALIVCGYYMSGYCFQQAVDINTGIVYTRTQTGGTWSSWEAINNSIVHG